ncbi:hypothetical protein K493DRAFT_297294 [Basidiobolus meristosporus CBS 931.73]|uniref:Spindle pole body component n=1 Tax=Basidiobolus meristosporus CBS 931.73 TaxID=1314790 RepID=A0A1Y1Z1T2_9FUNG|nr:hypothetical protein K493DRAFT_297294 [Basidiobolus meristosporus CBS 931.73]|eukprot:ORY03795.1 hypothetical protein K493DRAFT_297294 [Basidiobolus meristosporus CBS 931.73]
MLHELLLALSGHPGDIFVLHLTDSSTTPVFRIPEDFTFLHPSEKGALEQLAQLGGWYRRVKTFTEQHRSKEWLSGSSRVKLPHGAYFQGFCQGIRQALKDYEDAIVELEGRILKQTSSQTPLSLISSWLSPFFFILPHLDSLVGLIEEKPDLYHGGRLLSLLASKCESGVSEVRETMLKLTQHVRKVFYQQITSWIVYGTLADPHGEFFVKRLSSVHFAPNSKEAHETSYSQLENDNFTFQKLFTLDTKQIPDFIPIKVANSILFVGQSVYTIRMANISQVHSIPTFLTSKHLKLLLELSKSPVYRGIELESVVLEIRKDVSEWLWKVVLVGEKTLGCLEVFRKFFLLGSGDYFLQLIESFEALRTARQKEMRKVVIKEQELNAMMIQSSVGTSVEDDPTLEKLSFRVTPASTKPGYDSHKDELSDTHSPSNLYNDLLLFGSRIELQYSISWPMDLIFTDVEMERYNALMSFLLVLRRTHNRLQKVWMLGNAVRRQDLRWQCKGRLHDESRFYEPKEMAHDERMWRLRTKMLHFVDSIWSHVQTDAIETCSTDFSELIRATALTQPGEVSIEGYRGSTKPLHDFEDIRSAHSLHLDQLFAACLLFYRPLSLALRKIFVTCDTFCNQLEKGLSSDSKIFHFEENEHPVERIEQEFGEQSEFFFRTVSDMNRQGGSNTGPARHLDQLLLRLDFNNTYSLARTTLN